MWLDSFSSILKFAQQGGEVIWVLMLISILLWLLIFERYIFIYRIYPRYFQQTVNAWARRDDQSSWRALKIKEALLSQNDLQLKAKISTIKVLIALCPLVGLLGTVTGMVDVFDVIAITGTSDAKVMASSIYQAILPTMSGLVLALSALYFNYHIIRKAGLKYDALQQQLNNEVNTL